MYIRRNIRAGCSERIYHVVKNAMSIQAETGRVMFYLTGGYGIGTVSSWVLASYASELLRENFWGQMAGVVQNGPIGPGEYGLVVAHGWVSSALVLGPVSQLLSERDWPRAVFMPYETTVGDSAYGAFTWSVVNAGLLGTYMTAGVAVCCALVCPGAYISTPYLAELGWFPVLLRLM